MVEMKKSIRVRKVMDELRPNVYSPTTPVYQSVEKALHKLSHEELDNLQMLILCQQKKKATPS